jgi:glycine amidinotransferase
LKINSHNEWDKLREVIVGTSSTKAGLVFNRPGPVPPKVLEEAQTLASAAYPEWLIEEIRQDQEALCQLFRKLGIIVHRPNPSEINNLYSTARWSAAGENVSNTRDLHLVVGNTVIESPSQERFRFFEATALYDVWHQYMEQGFRWIAAPKPRLAGDYMTSFHEGAQKYIRLSEKEILFEAANTVRMGQDLLYLISRSGNALGAQWLQQVLGDEYRIHTTEDIYRSSHIDSTVLCLRPGLVLLNASRVNESNCPPLLKKWDRIWFSDIVPTPPETLHFQENVRKKIHLQLADLGVQSNLDDISSAWIGMNILSVDPDTVIVDQRQVPLIRILEKHGLTPVPISFRHSYITGGIHCNTLDTVRDSKWESYF